MGASQRLTTSSRIRLPVSSKAGSSVIPFGAVQVTVRDYQFTLGAGAGFWCGFESETTPALMGGGSNPGFGICEFLEQNAGLLKVGSDGFPASQGNHPVHQSV